MPGTPVKHSRTALGGRRRVLQEKLLHPDSKDRVGLGSLLRLTQDRLGGRAPSSFVAQLLEDNTIVLRPRVEVDPEEFQGLALSEADRDAFIEALRKPPAPSKKLKAAFRRYKERARGA